MRTLNAPSYCSTCTCYPHSITHACTFFAPAFKSKTNTNLNGTPDLTLVRPTPVVVEMPEGEAA
ncbi:hypothetical protein G5S52_20630 [Grimontia sp. S25]|uniref:Uncharacterized protein n=1 Tax=Grimontia sedimenti TaxID=2711294 RepID=A0A6M1RPR9_9GAMM|nr:hypothetical protein [Grimontia sedimenti]NGN99948.1 hypothetical protein [Grimontia sedimenti]